MEWLSTLAFLACPLMMLFCMKGMFSGGGKCDKDQKGLTRKVEELIQQNQRLQNELETLKKS